MENLIHGDVISPVEEQVQQVSNELQANHFAESEAYQADESHLLVSSPIEEQVKQVKELLQARVNDYNSIFSNFHEKNERVASNLTMRLDAIASSPVDFPMKRKSIAKIGKYLSIIIAEADELKLKPKKARVKDIERLITYFDTMDKFISRIERKILYKIIQTEKNNIFAQENFIEYNDKI